MQHPFSWPGLISEIVVCHSGFGILCLHQGTWKFLESRNMFYMFLPQYSVNRNWWFIFSWNPWFFPAFPWQSSPSHSRLTQGTSFHFSFALDSGCHQSTWSFPQDTWPIYFSACSSAGRAHPARPQDPVLHRGSTRSLQTPSPLPSPALQNHLYSAAQLLVKQISCPLWTFNSTTRGRS